MRKFSSFLLLIVGALSLGALSLGAAAGKTAEAPQEVVAVPTGIPGTDANSVSDYSIQTPAENMIHRLQKVECATPTTAPGRDANTEENHYIGAAGTQKE